MVGGLGCSAASLHRIQVIVFFCSYLHDSVVTWATRHTRLAPIWQGLTKLARTNEHPGGHAVFSPLDRLPTNEEKSPAGLNFKHARFKYQSHIAFLQGPHSTQLHRPRAGFGRHGVFSHPEIGNIPAGNKAPLVKFSCLAFSVTCALWKLLTDNPASCPACTENAQMCTKQVVLVRIGRICRSDIHLRYDTCMLACNSHDGLLHGSSYMGHGRLSAA